MDYSNNELLDIVGNSMKFSHSNHSMSRTLEDSMTIANVMIVSLMLNKSRVANQHLQLFQWLVANAPVYHNPQSRPVQT